MFTIRRKIIAGIAVCISAAAIAATMYGPFAVSAAGPEYVRTDFDTDQYAEFQAAGVIVKTYVAAVLRTPTLQTKAMLNGDYVRVVYADGQIADFKFQFNSVNAAILLGKVPAANFKRLSESQLEDIDRRNNVCATATPTIVSYQTGYFGQRGEIGADGSTMIITGQWIDTGNLNITFNNSVRCQYR